jgi:hypothetical protein
MNHYNQDVRNHWYPTGHHATPHDEGAAADNAGSKGQAQVELQVNAR